MERPFAAVADDLSGAAEVAMVLRGLPARVALTGHGFQGTPDDVPVVVDVDTRNVAPDLRRRRIREAVAALHARGRVVVYCKVDSLVRGGAADIVFALQEAGLVPVVATALPALRRSVIGGRSFVEGVPLLETGLVDLEAEPSDGPVTVIGADRSVSIGLDIVNRGPEELRSAIRDAISHSRIPVIDGVTDAHLDTVVDALSGLDGVVLVGSGGAAAALGRTAAVDERREEALGPLPGRESVLIVVGTASSAAEGQLAELERSGFPVVELSHDLLLRAAADGVASVMDDASVRAVVDALSAGTTAVAVRRSDPVAPELARPLAGGLGAIAAAVAGESDLVLTGGETARAVLDRLDVHSLHPVRTLGAGTVLSLTPDGRSVVTKPGSFGDRTSLLRAVSVLRDSSPGAPDASSSSPLTKGPSSMNSTPLVAVTMGDGAGVGPEIIVDALLDPSVRAVCRPVVIGDLGRLRRAAQVRGAAVEFHRIDRVEDARNEAGVIDVIDLGLLPPDLPWGELSPVAGDAAYQYVRVASELAMSGAVQAICTAPLNKEALHAGGHLFPGHTEMLAQLMGVDEVSMMLSTPGLKVIHVTTHIGLIDAVARIEPGIVERTIRRGHEALVRAGNPHPRIGVAAINPHAGENGLFGYGEEATKIAPGVEAARRDGIDARGPLPADTLFFLAGRGDYDLVVAMYHDQGHGPVKVLGIEAGVNVTVGLPVIRTSVDHGTAFDIAGKGVADAASMIEALRQSAELATVTAAVR